MITDAILVSFSDSAQLLQLCIPFQMFVFQTKSFLGSGGIRTHAIEMTGALNQRLRPLGHATLLTANLFPNDRADF